jgi:hypothetical protein
VIAYAVSTAHIEDMAPQGDDEPTRDDLNFKELVYFTAKH